MPETASTRSAKRAHERELRVLHAAVALDVDDTSACLTLAVTILRDAREAAARWGRLEGRIKGGAGTGAAHGAAVRLLTNRAHADLERMFAKPTARVARFDGTPLRYDQIIAACARAPSDVVGYARGDGPCLTAGRVHAMLLEDHETLRDAAQFLALRKLALLHVGHETSFLASAGKTP